MRFFIVSLLVVSAGCATFPELDNRIDAAAREAPYPTLTNIAPLLAQAGSVPTSNTALTQDIANQVAQLNRRADRLRGPVVEGPVRARMSRGINTSALP